MSSSMIEKWMFHMAIKTALPSAEELWKSFDPDCKGVVIAIWADGMEEPYFEGTTGLGDLSTLLERFQWDFLRIVLEKLDIARRTGKPSRLVRWDKPYQLHRGNSKYGGAVAVDHDLAVSVSGSKEWIDEVIAWAVHTLIWGFCMEQVLKIPEDQDTV